jgi:hypothetical protein
MDVSRFIRACKRDLPNEINFSTSLQQPPIPMRIAKYMTDSTMNILLLGGTQAFGPGLSNQKSYVAQLLRRLRADGHQVQLDQYGPLALNEASDLLAKLHLYRYDVILLQLGDAEVDSVTLPTLRRLWLGLRRDRASHLRRLRHQLATVLMLVQPYRQKTLLLSPLPQSTPSLLHRLARYVFLDEAQLWAVPSVDTDAVLESSPEFFQPEATCNLSSLGHELLGSELHGLLNDYEPSPPSPPDVPRWRRLFPS